MVFRPMTLAFLGLILVTTVAHAQTQLSFDLMTDATVVNHYPGEDLLIGTADDIVNSASAGGGPSEPNYPGALSYFTVTFPGIPLEQPEFQGDFIRFATGGLNIEATGLKANSFSVTVTTGTFNGTSANPFIGRSITTLGEQFGNPDNLMALIGSKQLSGTFDHATLAPDRNGGPGLFEFADQIVMSGTVVVVKKVNFGISGDAYLDNVVAPLVTSASVTGLIRLELDFTEVQDPDEGLNGVQVHAVFVAATTGEIPPLSPDEEATPTASFTLTMTPTASPSPTEIAMATSTPTFTFTLTPTVTETATETATETQEAQAATPTFTEIIEATFTCSGDLDRDGDIDFNDLLDFILQMRNFVEEGK